MLGIGLQAILVLYSRAVSALAGLFVSAFLFLLSAGKMSANLPVGFFGLEFSAGISVVVSMVWFAFAGYLVFREARFTLIPMIKQASLGFARGLMLFVMLIAGMAVIVFPAAFLASASPLVFTLLVTAFLFALCLFYLRRKYMSILAHDAGDTRKTESARPSLIKRYLFQVLLRPCLMVLLALAYAMLLALVFYSALWGVLGLVFLTLCGMLGARLLRQTEYVLGND
jgi:hypothetical protein